MTRNRTLAASVAAISFAASAVVGQEAADPPASLMERGAQMFLEGLLREVEPALKDLDRLARDLGPSFLEFAEQMGPALTSLMEQVEDWTAYHPPEILPNGDIIMRRKTDVPGIAEGEEIEI